jgi:hypothetical protein
MARHKLLLNDGDNVCIVARIEPSCADMAHVRPAVSRNFRVVADVRTPTLILVPLNKEAGALSEEELNRF